MLLNPPSADWSVVHAEFAIDRELIELSHQLYFARELKSIYWCIADNFRLHIKQYDPTIHHFLTREWKVIQCV